MLGTADLNVKINGYIVVQNFLIVTNLSHDVILGMDFLQQTNAIVRAGDRILDLFDGLIVTPLMTREDSDNVLRLARTVTIPPRTEAFVPVILSRKFQHCAAITEPMPFMYEKLIGVARGVVQPRNRDTICRLMNLTHMPRTLRAGTAIAYLQPIDMNDEFNQRALQQRPRAHHVTAIHTISQAHRANDTHLTFADKRKALEDRGLNFNDCMLNDSDFEQLCDLLYDYRHLFITHETDLPESKLPLVTIPLKDNIPVRQQQFRLPPTMAKELQNRLDQLEQAGILEQSTSPYNSPTFLVRKFSKPGDPPSYRLVTDFRKLNEKIPDLFYTMCDIEQCVDMVAQQLKPDPNDPKGTEPKELYLSILDCKSGFYSLVLDPASRPCTAISGPKGHFQYRRLAMGLKCSSILYSMALTNLLRDVLNTERCLIYQDDILVATTSLACHLFTLKAIFAKYDEAQVRFNSHKSSLCVPRATFLGWSIDKNGLGIDPKRCEVIKKFKPPTNIKEVRAFLGAVNYWRKSLPRLPAIAEPLYRLTQKDHPFIWGTQQQQAFQKIKDLLMSDLILAWPRDHAQATCPYILEVDASPQGLGCLLKQADDRGTERVIAYQGRSLHKHEKNAPQVILETLALVAGITWFQSILSHVTHPFIIRSDNLALTYLNSLKYNKSQKLLRYGLLLSNYNFKLQHISASKNQMADCISRMPLEEDDKADATPDPEPLLGLDPNIYLGVISDDIIAEGTPSERQIRKSQDRHRRKHTLIAYLDAAPKANEQQPTIASIHGDAAASASATSTPVHADHAPNIQLDNRLVNLQSQATDSFFAHMIRYLTDGDLPTDRETARTIVFQSEFFQIEGDQLIRLATYKRKRQAQLNPMFKQLCIPEAL